MIVVLNFNQTESRPLVKRLITVLCYSSEGEVRQEPAILGRLELKLTVFVSTELTVLPALRSRLGTTYLLKYPSITCSQFYSFFICIFIYFDFIRYFSKYLFYLLFFLVSLRKYMFVVQLKPSVYLPRHFGCLLTWAELYNFPLFPERG